MSKTDKSSDFLWKIVLAGDSFSGKTTIRKRAMGEHFAEEYISTVGADFSSYKLKYGDLTIGFQVWDLAGQDKYKYIRSSFYGGATGCFLVFDTTNPKSMRNLSSWVDEAIRYSNGTIEIFIICANKIDLINRREISRETGEKYAQALRESSGLQCEYIETSALTGENVNIAFDKMAKCLLEREGVSPIKPKEDVQEPITQVAQEEQILTAEFEALEKEVEKPISRIIDTIPSTRKSIMMEDDSEEETERLIAEVMNVLDETEEIIIGRETTQNGERVITVPKSSIEEKLPEKEEEPKISSELERVLTQINSKLDSLTERLKGLEVEISHVKEDDQESEEVEETIEDVRDELDILAQLPLPSEEPVKEEATTFDEPLTKPIDLQPPVTDQITDTSEDYNEEAALTEIIDTITPEPLPPPPPPPPKEEEEDQLTKDQHVLESLLELDPPEPITTVEDAPAEDEEEAIEETIPTGSTNFRGLDEIPNDELVDIPNEEPLLAIEDEDEDDPEDEGLIGTELSSAMISELKDMSEEAEKQSEPSIAPKLQTESTEKKSVCPICGEAMKYIRQYKKYYCVKCGRYLI